MTRLKNLDDLFVRTLCRVYDTERRLTTTLPKMAEAADAVELKHALTWHFNQTKAHVDRIERVFGLLNRVPEADANEPARGIVQASQDVIDLNAGTSVKDAALIAAVQEAEHYQIAAYGTLRTWAQVMNKPEAAQLLGQTLAEEKKADQTLSAIAGGLNPQAVGDAALH